MINDDLPLRYPTKPETDIFGGISTSMWMWSGHTSASTIFTCLNSQSFLKIFPISSLLFPKNACLRYLGANTIWYLQFQHVCAKLKLSVDIYLLSYSSVGPHEYCKEISFSGQNYKFYLHPRLSGGFNSLIVCTMAQTIKEWLPTLLFLLCLDIIIYRCCLRHRRSYV